MQEIFTHNIPAFIFVLGIIIFVHESGHLLVAKAFGMRVFIFSFGFGKRLFGFQWGDTDCRVSLIPLGGYVKLEGEPEDLLSEDTSAQVVGDGRDFLSRPRWQRLLVYLAGPAMNVALTLSVLSVLFYTIGWAVDSTRYEQPILGAIDPGSPAEAAGLKTGDQIVSIDGEALPTWESVQYHVVLRPDRDLAVAVKRDGERRETKIHSASTDEDKIGTIGVHPLVRIGELVKDQPAAEAGLQVDDAILKIDDQPVREFSEIPDLVKGATGKSLRLLVWRAGEVLEVGVVPRDSGQGPRIGIGGKTIHKRFGAVASLVEAARFSWQNTKLTFDVLKRLVSAQISPKTMMGPLGIAKAAGERAKDGPASLFFLIAVISLQVGILNLFPLAPLDGGHMAILLGEGLFRRDFSVTVKTWVMNAGLLVVLLLVVVSSYSDLSKSFLGKYLP